ARGSGFFRLHFSSDLLMRFRSVVEFVSLWSPGEACKWLVFVVFVLVGCCLVLSWFAVIAWSLKIFLSVLVGFLNPLVVVVLKPAAISHGVRGEIFRVASYSQQQLQFPIIGLYKSLKSANYLFIRS
ncbi:unnamed protein product, partial [Brassica rapa subsp. narinosa]